MELHTIMHAIFTQEELAKQLQERVPNLTADIISYRLNPNCTCKQKISNHILNNAEDRKFLIDWISSFLNSASVEIVDKKTDITPRMVLKTSLPPSEWGKYKDMIGQHVEIDANPDKYKELMAIAREKWLYNGLSVLETVKTDSETKTEKFIWIVFFY
jgi:hypothetical protein